MNKRSAQTVVQSAMRDLRMIDFRIEGARVEPDRRPVLVLGRSQDFYQWQRLQECSASLVMDINSLRGRSDENTRFIRLTGWQGSYFMSFSGAIEMLDEFFPHWRSSPIETVSMQQTSPIAVPKECLTCTDYHGRFYGGNFLVCGIYPKGRQVEDSCPDRRT